MNHIKLAGIYLLVVAVLYLNCCSIIKPYHAVTIPQKTVKLTFDDGPNAHKNVTESVLDVLKSHNIKGYFCLIGMNVERYPGIVKRIYDEGHEIVNHGYTDRFIVFKKNDEIRQDIIKCNNAIGKALEVDDYCPKFYRPPNGLYKPSTRKIWQNFDMEILPITSYELDAQRNSSKANKVIAKVIKHIKRHNGGIILLHDGRDSAVKLLAEIAKDSTSSYDRSWIPDALDSIVTVLKREGYVFE